MEEFNSNDKSFFGIRIVCPKCKWEYLAGEILEPLSLVGKPRNIIRDAIGHIIFADYEEDNQPDLQERYVCDHCNTEFIINAKLVANTEEVSEEENFNDLEVSLW